MGILTRQRRRRHARSRGDAAGVLVRQVVKHHAGFLGRTDPRLRRVCQLYANDTGHKPRQSMRPPCGRSRSPSEFSPAGRAAVCTRSDADRAHGPSATQQQERRQRRTCCIYKLGCQRRWVLHEQTKQTWVKARVFKEGRKKLVLLLMTWLHAESPPYLNSAERGAPA